MDDKELTEQQLEIKIQDSFRRKCLVCNQDMEHQGDLVWYCKRCDTLTTITPLIKLVSTKTEGITKIGNRFVTSINKINFEVNFPSKLKQKYVCKRICQYWKKKRCIHPKQCQQMR